MPALYDYGTHHHNLTPDEVARHLKHWNPGLYLVFEMEEDLKNLNLMPSDGLVEI